MKQAKDRVVPGARADLCRALLTLETETECRQFLEDLCTPAELEAIADRWRVALYLNRGMPYRRIHDETGVSVTTIGRVARFLDTGSGGYRTALSRVSADGEPA